MKYTVTIVEEQDDGSKTEARVTRDNIVSWIDVLEDCVFPCLRGVGFCIDYATEVRILEACD